jgi:hypothetical protein
LSNANHPTNRGWTRVLRKGSSISCSTRGILRVVAKRHHPLLVFLFISDSLHQNIHFCIKRLSFNQYYTNLICFSHKANWHTVKQRPFKGTCKCGLYEQWPFIYRSKSYALFINGIHESPLYRQLLCGIQRCPLRQGWLYIEFL